MPALGTTTVGTDAWRTRADDTVPSRTRRTGPYPLDPRVAAFTLTGSERASRYGRELPAGAPPPATLTE